MIQPLRHLQRTVGICALLAVTALGFAADPAPVAAAPAAEAAPAVYRWDPVAYAAAPGMPVTVAMQKRDDGSERPRIDAAGGGWNVLIFVPVGVLHGASEYLATVRYEIAVPPKFPGTFHMFARSKALGIEHDAWLNWLGQPGERGIARLPMRLPAADDWTFSIGCKGPAALIVDSFEITPGTGFAYLPASPEASAPAASAAAPVATGCAAVVIDPPAPTTDIVVSTAEFGMTADGAAGPATPEVAAANALALSRALAACRTRNAAKLVIPPGVYRFNPKDPIAIEEHHDLTIDGQGAELIFTRLMRNVAVLNLRACKRVVLRGLRLDWDWSSSPIASLAVVESIADDRRSCVLRFPDLDAAATERTMAAAWTHLWRIDAATLLGDSTERFDCKTDKRERIDGNALRVAFTTPQNLVVGSSYCIRHLYYEMGAFKLTDCSHVLFDDVTIYSMPGMGWIGRGDLDHLGLRGCRIAIRPGSHRPLSTAADGFHILDSLGGILIEDSEITGTGDDCINIHDNCAQGVRKTGPATLVLVDNPRWRMKVAVGDRIELFGPDYAPSGFSAVVKQMTLEKNDTIVEFDAPLPETVSPLSIAFNRRYGTCDVRIVRSRFNRGRVLISARRATIEDCDFDHPFANAVQLHTEIVGTLWAEGSGADDVVIRDNVFRSANLRGKFNGAVIHGAPVLPAGRTEYPLFQRVLITGNRFIDSFGPAVNLAACRGVVVRGNRIESDQADPRSNAQAGAITVECSSDLDLGGNTWITGAGQRLPGVSYDPATTRNLHADGNRLAPR